MGNTEFPAYCIWGSVCVCVCVCVCGGGGGGVCVCVCVGVGGCLVCYVSEREHGR